MDGWISRVQEEQNPGAVSAALEKERRFAGRRDLLDRAHNASGQQLHARDFARDKADTPSLPAR